MPRRKNKRADEQSDPASSQSEDENYDNNHNKNYKQLDPEIIMNRQLLLEKIKIFKMIHENKDPDGKSLSNEKRMDSLNEIQTLFDNSGYKTTLDQHMIRSTNIRWLTYKEDMEYWELWDKKEEYLSRNSRSREREADRFRALNRMEPYRSRSRSRSRGRSMDEFRIRQRDRSRDRNGRYEEERRNKEQVK